MLKKIFLLTCYLCLTQNISNLAFADISPVLTDMTLTKAYLPRGFTEKDKVQIAVEGVFRNTCYRIGPHATKIDSDKHAITIQQQAYVFPGICLQVIVPFNNFIELGQVERGNYQILDYASGADLGILSVAPAGYSAEESFAQITDAYIVEDQNEQILVLKGKMSDRCSILEEVQVLYQNQVIVVRPLLKSIVDCVSDAGALFQRNVPLENRIKGLTLLHVKSAGGETVNRMVDLK